MGWALRVNPGDWPLCWQPGLVRLRQAFEPPPAFAQEQQPQLSRERSQPFETQAYLVRLRIEVWRLRLEWIAAAAGRSRRALRHRWMGEARPPSAASCARLAAVSSQQAASERLGVQQLPLLKRLPPEAPRMLHLEWQAEYCLHAVQDRRREAKSQQPIKSLAPKRDARGIKLE